MRNKVRNLLIALLLILVVFYSEVAAEKRWLAREAIPRRGRIMILWEDGTLTSPHLGQNDLAIIRSKKGRRAKEGQKPTILRGEETSDGYLFHLFDNEIAPRDNYPYATFSLSNRNQIESAKIIVTAYNDDRWWLRAVSFHLDGVGGYLGTHRIAPSQSRGDGVIRPKQTKTWEYDLANTKVSANIYGSNYVNFLDILKSKEEHTIKSAVSTYMKYGPNTSLSLDLVIKYKGQGE